MKKNVMGKETKFLIVDDDKGVRYFLTRFLKQKGYKEVQSAATGKEALKIIDEDRIKIVLLDIRLPGMDGVEVLRKIKARDKDIGVIMITGFPDEKIGQQCLELGASDYIMKPFDLAYLELNVLTKIVTMT
jgi:two-component system response regulator (stage 0 sporulation protein F)